MRPIYRSPPRTRWGIALEALRNRVTMRRGGKEFTQYELCQLARIPMPQYRALLQGGKGGPTLKTLQRFLDAMQFTWKDWADVYDHIEAERVLHAAESTGHYMKRRKVEKLSNPFPKAGK